MVVKRELLESFLSSGESLMTGNIGTLFNRILKDHLFVSRSAAEYDFDLKQVIPYVIVRHQNNFLLLRRTSKQTEKRLHNKYSLGIGGHINPSLPDDQGSNIIIKGLYRELHEEVLLGDGGVLSFEGIINDDSSSVSKVHLGLLYELEVESDEFTIREVDKMVGYWVDRKGLRRVYDQMETWSQIVLDFYIDRVQKKGCRSEIH